MIAVVKRRHAVLSALLFLIPAAADAADDLGEAARELARRTAAFGKADPAAIAWRNLSPLGSGDLAQARAAFEGALQESSRNGAAQPLTVRITLSQNLTQYLLVEEAQSVDDRQVWIISWKRTDNARSTAPGMALTDKLVFEQDDPILDVAIAGDALLVLAPSKIVLQEHAGSSSAPIPPPKSFPRDPRGRLRLSGNTFQAFLPGMTCSGQIATPLRIDCRSGDMPWVIESAARAIVLANLRDRNFFDGRIVTQTGAHKTIAPFYSAAAFEEQGRTWWVLAMLDGRAQIFDAAFESQGSFTQWGSDIAALDGRCGAAPVILATRPGDGAEPDAVQPFSISGGTPVPLASPVIFAGPVTALWPSGPSSAIAVAHDFSTGKYAAYVLTIGCGS